MKRLFRFRFPWWRRTVKSVSAEGAAHYRRLRDNCNTFVTPMLPLPALLLRSRKSLQLRGARIVLPEDRFVNPLREKISAGGFIVRRFQGLSPPREPVVDDGNLPADPWPASEGAAAARG